MVDILLNYRTLPQIARCAAIFSFAEHLTTPIKFKEVAQREGLDPGATLRLLRACVAFGLARIDDEGRFSDTPLLRTLRKDDPSALRDMAIAQEGWARWAPWSRLDRAIRTGKPQAETVLGMKPWDYLASPEGAEEAAAFTRSMAGLGRSFEAEAIDLIDTRQTALAVDVGGATGSFLRALAARNPALRGIVLDRQHLAHAATEAIEGAGLSDRLKFAVGDFTRDVPAADLYLLRWILHDWPDEICVKILRACRLAAEPKARLIIAEVVIDDAAPRPYDVSLDLHMLVSFGAKERTVAEYDALLDTAGFRLVGHTSTRSDFSILEAVAR